MPKLWSRSVLGRRWQKQGGHVAGEERVRRGCWEMRWEEYFLQRKGVGMGLFSPHGVVPFRPSRRKAGWVCSRAYSPPRGRHSSLVPRLHQPASPGWLLPRTPSWATAGCIWQECHLPRSCHNKYIDISGRVKYWNPAHQRSSSSLASRQPPTFPGSSESHTPSDNCYLLAKGSWLTSHHPTSPILSCQSALSVTKKPELPGQTQVGKRVGREPSSTFTFRGDLTWIEPALEELSVSPGLRPLVLGRLGIKETVLEIPVPF